MDWYHISCNFSPDYEFKANRFEIYDGILYFYDEGGSLICVIKEWKVFTRNKNENYT